MGSESNEILEVAVIGDTHGRRAAIEKQLKLLGIKHFLFTGDFYSDAKIIAHRLDLTFNGVVGNCDPPSGQELEEQLITLAGKKIFITHGHQYNVKYNLQNLFYRASELAADIVIYGHTHMSNIEYIDNICFLNPGSPSRPRGGSKASFILLKISENIIEPQLRLID